MFEWIFALAIVGLLALNVLILYLGINTIVNCANLLRQGSSEVKYELMDVKTRLDSCLHYLNVLSSHQAKNVE
jgi:hypothetical protein